MLNYYKLGLCEMPQSFTLYISRLLAFSTEEGEIYIINVR